LDRRPPPRVARLYDERLGRAGIGIPAPAGDLDHVYHVYAVCVRDRDATRARLAEAGIQTGVHYPIPVHLQPAYSDLGYGKSAFPITERLAMETLSLPMFPEITEAQVDEVCAALERVAGAAEVVDVG
jgi:dTDP-4-amino-4,6-dideoxygalactose transaminase